MGAKKKRGKGKERQKGLVDTPLEQLGEKETLMHYNAVLMEDIKSKFDLMIEGAESMRVEFDQRLTAIKADFDSLRIYMDRRFSMLEKALHSLKEDLIELEHRMNSRIDGVSDRCSKFDGRLTHLESVH